jgi:TonB family protein
VPPFDVSDSFLLDRSPRPAAGPEPVIEPRFSTASAGESLLTTVNPADQNRERTGNPRPLPLPLGLIGSLALHLLPLLLLLSWTTAPADIPPPIPVQLVIETPPSPPPAAQEAKKPPPRGPLASEDMGAPEAKRTEPSGAPEPPPEPLPDPTEIQTALVPPPPMPEPPREPAVVPQPKPKPAPKPPAPATLWRRLDAPHPGRVPGPAATRDEYLAYLVSLTRRHLDLLPLSMVGLRRGVTTLTIRVLDDGTVARISIAQSSGYPDIDERIERMVAAVGRFPPLPQWFQGPSMELRLRLQFPEALER